MTINLGGKDRLIRVLAGLVPIVLPYLAVWPLVSSGPWKVVSLLVGLVLIATAAIRFCPVYEVFGIRTCRT